MIPHPFVFTLLMQAIYAGQNQSAPLSNTVLRKLHESTEKLLRSEQPALSGSLSTSTGPVIDRFWDAPPALGNGFSLYVLQTVNGLVKVNYFNKCSRAIGF